MVNILGWILAGSWGGNLLVDILERPDHELVGLCAKKF